MSAFGRLLPVATSQYGAFFSIAAVFFERGYRKRISTIRELDQPFSVTP